MADLHPVCARFHLAVELVGARWSGAILRALFTGQYRFVTIKAAIPGISDTMLAQRLRELESAAIIERRWVSSAPVLVEYHLTERGRELAPVMDALLAWSHRWIELPGTDPAAPAGPGTDPAASPTPVVVPAG